VITLRYQPVPAASRSVGKKSDRRAGTVDQPRLGTDQSNCVLDSCRRHAWHVLAARSSCGRMGPRVRYAFGCARANARPRCVVGVFRGSTPSWSRRIGQSPIRSNRFLHRPGLPSHSSRPPPARGQAFAVEKASPVLDSRPRSGQGQALRWVRVQPSLLARCVAPPNLFDGAVSIGLAPAKGHGQTSLPVPPAIACSLAKHVLRGNDRVKSV
jgi:hypothetical protein